MYLITKSKKKLSPSIQSPHHKKFTPQFLPDKKNLSGTFDQIVFGNQIVSKKKKTEIFNSYCPQHTKLSPKHCPIIKAPFQVFHIPSRKKKTLKISFSSPSPRCRKLSPKALPHHKKLSHTNETFFYWEKKNDDYLITKSSIHIRKTCPPSAL